MKKIKYSFGMLIENWRNDKVESSKDMLKSIRGLGGESWKLQEDMFSRRKM